MKTITISSSLRFKELVQKAIDDLKEVGIIGLFPNLNNTIAKEDVTQDLMRKIEIEHFQAIESSVALYVICPNGYVGTLVSVEIGYAYAKNKPIIFSETPEDLGLQAVATKIVPLKKIQTDLFNQIDN